MKKILLYAFMIIFINTAITSNTFAYSYGDPNEEKVAEAYKEIKIKLNEEPANFKAAKEIYSSVQEEIDMHMGEEPSQIIMEDFKEENKENILEDMEKILVLNISRRLESIEKDFSNFENNKKLLAKAYATYKALSPIIAEKDVKKDEEIHNQFDLALESLGNPGLFGVGKKESDEKVFKESKDQILAPLQEEFDLASLEVGHFSESATEKEQSSGKSQDWTDLSNMKNWLPLAIILFVIGGVAVYSIRRKRK